jgi:hypothetical protein
MLHLRGWEAALAIGDIRITGAGNAKAASGGQGGFGKNAAMRSYAAIMYRQ